MSKREQRRAVSFTKWAPTAHAMHIGYSYVDPRSGRTISPGTDRWMRAKSHVAEAALCSGAYEFRVYGGAGARTWERVVTVSQAEAEAFFQDAIDRGAFMLKGTLRRALARRDARLRATT